MSYRVLHISSRVSYISRLKLNFKCYFCIQTI
nr:MAG TPA_asm: aspartate carbamoyltransferase regulatory subunit [Caudoviricetes sp.]